jgi:hypothetical protein
VVARARVVGVPTIEEFTVMADADAPTTLVQKLGAEAIGTFALVLVGCGVAVTSDGDLVATGFAFGLTITFMVYALGRISGGHFNPAVSIGAAIGGRVSWREAGTYIGAQFVGASRPSTPTSRSAPTAGARAATTTPCGRPCWSSS